MKATIWHNPRCSKSRATLGLLTAAGAEVTVIAYLERPPSAAELARLYTRAGLSPREGLRADAPPRQDPGLDDGAILDAMAADPRLIERPLVETDLGVRLCRPPERVNEILPV